MTVLEYFGRKRGDPAAVTAVMGVALEYGRVLLQLRTARFEVTSPAAVTQAVAQQVWSGRGRGGAGAKGSRRGQRGGNQSSEPLTLLCL